MNALTFTILIILIILVIRTHNKKKKEKILMDDVKTDDYFTPPNENYIYIGDLPRETEDLIISFKTKGASVTVI